jgi:hypothetical protein
VKTDPRVASLGCETVLEEAKKAYDYLVSMSAEGAEGGIESWKSED